MSQPPIQTIPPKINKAILNAFSVQLSTTATIQKLSMDPLVVRSYEINCLSTLMLKSSTLVGSLSICFSSASYLNLLERMIGEKFTEVTNENCDAASEILNIIFGGARKEMNESGFDFEPAIPATVIGKNLELSKANLAGQSLFFQCQSELGEFLVILALRTLP